MLLTKNVKPSMQSNDMTLSRTVLNRLSSSFMKSGKRNASAKIIHKSATILKAQGQVNPYKSIVEAIFILKPMVELRSFKKSGQSIQVPSAVTEYRQIGLAIRRLKDVSLKGDKPTSINLANEVSAILRGEGSQALVKRDSLHRMAIAQRGAMKLN